MLYDLEESFSVPHQIYPNFLDPVANSNWTNLVMVFVLNKVHFFQLSFTDIKCQSETHWPWQNKDVATQIGH